MSFFLYFALAFIGLGIVVALALVLLGLSLARDEKFSTGVMERVRKAGL